MSKMLTIGYDENDNQGIPALHVVDHNGKGCEDTISMYHGDWAKIIFSLLMGHVVPEELWNPLRAFCHENEIRISYKLKVFGFVTFNFKSLRDKNKPPLGYGLKLEDSILYPKASFNKLKDILNKYYNLGISDNESIKDVISPSETALQGIKNGMNAVFGDPEKGYSKDPVYHVVRERIKKLCKNAGRKDMITPLLYCMFATSVLITPQEERTPNDIRFLLGNSYKKQERVDKNVMESNVEEDFTHYIFVDRVYPDKNFDETMLAMHTIPSHVSKFIGSLVFGYSQGTPIDKFYINKDSILPESVKVFNNNFRIQPPPWKTYASSTDYPFTYDISIGPFDIRDEAVEWLQRLKKDGYSEARIYKFPKNKKRTDNIDLKG